MATQLSLVAASNKVQFIRKGTLRDCACLRDNTKNCNWACWGFVEPKVSNGDTYIQLVCSARPITISVPTADFSDTR
jgi:hypothetical protein